jgi:hypothetical protein
MLSLKNDLLNLHIKFLGSLSSKISIKSYYSKSLIIYIIELFDSCRRGRIFFNAKVPNSSPITAAAFINIIPFIASSPFLGFDAQLDRI